MVPVPRCLTMFCLQPRLAHALHTLTQVFVHLKIHNRFHRPATERAPHAGLEAADIYCVAELPERLIFLQSEHRTLDPEEADFFYAPVYVNVYVWPVWGWADGPWYHSIWGATSRPNAEQKASFNRLSIDCQ